jgi:hypothetical protein
MYILEKLVMYARNHTLMRRHERAGGVADFAQLDHPPATIGFDFSDARHVHIGDHLFLEPTMRACRLRGVDVCVSPIPAMRDYFRQAGYTVVDSETARRQELRVSSVYMYDCTPRRERHQRFLYLNTIDHRITRPVAEHLAEQVVRAARLDPATPVIDGRPYLLPAGPTLLDTQPLREGDRGWIVFNDAVDSGWFRVLPADRRRLADVAAERRREGFRIVRVGSAADLAKRPDPLGIEDLDLRGRTTVLDLFRLLGSAKVAGTISFDTVVAHMGMAYDKPAIVRLRRFTPGHQRFLKRHLIPPFAGGASIPVEYV